MKRILAAATALSLIAGAGLITAPEAFAQAAPATPAQKAEPMHKGEMKKKKEEAREKKADAKKSDAKKSERAKEKAKSGRPKTETKAEPKK